MIHTNRRLPSAASQRGGDGVPAAAHGQLGPVPPAGTGLAGEPSKTKSVRIPSRKKPRSPAAFTELILPIRSPSHISQTPDKTTAQVGALSKPGKTTRGYF